jgi:DNA-binding NtrC family response regulator
VIERAVTLENGEQISVESLPGALRSKAPLVAISSSASPEPGKVLSGAFIQVPTPDFSNGKLKLADVLAPIEKAYADAALKKAGGKKKEAAALLGVTVKEFGRISGK